MMTDMPLLTTELSDAQTELPKTPKTKSLHVLLLGKHIDLIKVSEKLSHQYFCQQYKNALFVNLPRGNAFVFKYGVVVFWSVIDTKRNYLVNQITPYVKQTSESRIIEMLQYSVQSTQLFSINDNTLVIPNTNVHTLLSCSHALAQSCKIAHYENIIEHLIDQHLTLTECIATKGKIHLTRKALLIKRGKLFNTKSDILLHFNLLDLPAYFWQYPEQEALYNKLGAYLELKTRVEILSHKLITINDLLDILAAEQEHKYAAALQWIIVLMIAANIVAYLVFD